MTEKKLQARDAKMSKQVKQGKHPFSFHPIYTQMRELKDEMNQGSMYWRKRAKPCQRRTRMLVGLW